MVKDYFKPSMVASSVAETCKLMPVYGVRCILLESVAFSLASSSVETGVGKNISIPGTTRWKEK
jgi:hypothetical protein